ncbi:unnamed protein product [Ixodes hexagonus]
MEYKRSHSRRNESQSYECALKAGERCPALKVEVVRKALKSYINTQLDLSSCPRLTGRPPCDRGPFLLCYWNSSRQIKFAEPDNLLYADSLAEDCNVPFHASAALFCEIQISVQHPLKGPLQYTFSGLKPALGLISDNVVTQSKNNFYNILKRDGTRCSTRTCLGELVKGTLGSRHQRQTRREREEKFKCELLAVESCPSSASLARKAVLNFKLSLFELDECPRPKVDGGSGDSGFSITPKLFVTLAAPLVSLLPLRT